MGNHFYVYLISRPDGRPCYVGKGRGNRLNFHAAAAKYGKHWNKHLQNIISLAGGFLPIVKLRENLSEEEAFRFESETIRTIGREPAGPLVNLTDGGEGVSGLVFSPASRQKMRETALKNGNTPPSQKGMIQSQDAIEKRRTKLLGRRLTEDHKAKLILANKSRVVTEFSREKMRAAKLGKKQSLETVEKRIAPLRGKKRPPEWGRKISEAKMGHNVSEETKRKIGEAARLRHLSKSEQVST